MNHANKEYGFWVLVVFYSLLLIVFAFSFARPKTKRDWRSFGTFSAFVIALFSEMYGFPLTMYLLSSWLGSKFPQLANPSHASGHLWFTLLRVPGNPHANIFHLLSNVFIFGGVALVIYAWRVLYSANKEDWLATTGPYRYVRHPQYVGFVLVMIGFLIQWPTLPTLVMFPILVAIYVNLAKREENDTRGEFGYAWDLYAVNTPRFFPNLAPGRTARLKEFAVSEDFRKFLLAGGSTFRVPSLDGVSNPERAITAIRGKVSLEHRFEQRITICGNTERVSVENCTLFFRSWGIVVADPKAPVNITGNLLLEGGVSLLRREMPQDEPPSYQPVILESNTIIVKRLGNTAISCRRQIAVLIENSVSLSALGANGVSIIDSCASLKGNRIFGDRAKCGLALWVGSTDSAGVSLVSEGDSIDGGLVVIGAGASASFMDCTTFTNCEIIVSGSASASFDHCRFFGCIISSEPGAEVRFAESTFFNTRFEESPPLNECEVARLIPASDAVGFLSHSTAPAESSPPV